MKNHSGINGKFSIAIILKWIFGILMAGLLSVGLGVLVMHHSGPVDMGRLTGFQYWLTLFITPPIALALFVFLSCAFVPSRKKYAGILVVSLCTFFIGMGAYEHYTYDGFLATQFKIIYSGFITGLAAGFVISYKVFKENKWTES